MLPNGVTVYGTPDVVDRLRQVIETYDIWTDKFELDQKVTRTYKARLEFDNRYTLTCMKDAYKCRICLESTWEISVDDNLRLGHYPAWVYNQH